MNLNENNIQRYVSSDKTCFNEFSTMDENISAYFYWHALVFLNPDRDCSVNSRSTELHDIHFLIGNATCAPQTTQTIAEYSSQRRSLT